MTANWEGCVPMPVRCDSRKVLPGDTFAAISGSRADGADFIQDAVARGAAKIVYAASAPPETFLPGVAYQKVEDPRFYFAEAVRAECGFPDRSLALYGVTGTNGKTTSAYILRRLLGEDRCGLLSTVAYFDGAKEYVSDQTTPDPERLFGMFRRMAENGLAYVAMELSSHALSQSRTGGAQFAGAIFTNFTGDHLDYHRTEENYFAAKKRLFLESLDGDGVAALNRDDPAVETLVSDIRRGRAVTFGQGEGANYRIRVLSAGAEGSCFLLNGEEYRFGLPGRHNVYNLAGVLAVLLERGFRPGALREKLARPFSVPGRLEKIALPNGAGVFIDYAHTDDALRKILQAVREISSGRLTVVFGCGGDRDRTKRPRMGEVAARYADKVIVTSDNPRSEDPERIIGEVLRGVPAAFREKVLVEPDRAAAIALAVSGSVPEESIVIAGKGHEDYQEVCGVKRHFSDREEVLQHL